MALQVSHRFIAFFLVLASLTTWTTPSYALRPKEAAETGLEEQIAQALFPQPPATSSQQLAAPFHAGLEEGRILEKVPYAPQTRVYLQGEEARNLLVGILKDGQKVRLRGVVYLEGSIPNDPFETSPFASFVSVEEHDGKIAPSISTRDLIIVNTNRALRFVHISSRNSPWKPSKLRRAGFKNATAQELLSPPKRGASRSAAGLEEDLDALPVAEIQDKIKFWERKRANLQGNLRSDESYLGDLQRQLDEKTKYRPASEVEKDPEVKFLNQQVLTVSNNIKTIRGYLPQMEPRLQQLRSHLLKRAGLEERKSTARGLRQVINFVQNSIGIKLEPVQKFRKHWVPDLKTSPAHDVFFGGNKHAVVRHPYPVIHTYRGADPVEVLKVFRDEFAHTPSDRRIINQKIQELKRRSKTRTAQTTTTDLEERKFVSGLVRSMFQKQLHRKGIREIPVHLEIARGPGGDLKARKLQVLIQERHRPQRGPSFFDFGGSFQIQKSFHGFTVSVIGIGEKPPQPALELEFGNILGNSLSPDIREAAGLYEFRAVNLTSPRKTTRWQKLTSPESDPYSSLHLLFDLKTLGFGPLARGKIATIDLLLQARRVPAAGLEEAKGKFSRRDLLAGAIGAGVGAFLGAIGKEAYDARTGRLLPEELVTRDEPQVDETWSEGHRAPVVLQIRAVWHIGTGSVPAPGIKVETALSTLPGGRKLTTWKGTILGVASSFKEDSKGRLQPVANDTGKESFHVYIPQKNLHQRISLPHASIVPRRIQFVLHEVSQTIRDLTIGDDPVIREGKLLNKEVTIDLGKLPSYQDVYDEEEQEWYFAIPARIVVGEPIDPAKTPGAPPDRPFHLSLREAALSYDAVAREYRIPTEGTRSGLEESVTLAEAAQRIVSHNVKEVTVHVKGTTQILPETWLSGSSVGAVQRRLTEILGLQWYQTIPWELEGDVVTIRPAGLEEKTRQATLERLKVLSELTWSLYRDVGSAKGRSFGEILQEHLGKTPETIRWMGVTAENVQGLLGSAGPIENLSDEQKSLLWWSGPLFHLLHAEYAKNPPVVSDGQTIFRKLPKYVVLNRLQGILWSETDGWRHLGDSALGLVERAKEMAGFSPTGLEEEGPLSVQVAVEKIQGLKQSRRITHLYFTHETQGWPAGDLSDSLLELKVSSVAKPLKDKDNGEAVVYFWFDEEYKTLLVVSGVPLSLYRTKVATAATDPPALRFAGRAGLEEREELTETTLLGIGDLVYSLDWNLGKAVWTVAQTQGQAGDQQVRFYRTPTGEQERDHIAPQWHSVPQMAEEGYTFRRTAGLEEGSESFDRYFAVLTKAVMAMTELDREYGGRKKLNLLDQSIVFDISARQSHDTDQARHSLIGDLLQLSVPVEKALKEFDRRWEENATIKSAPNSNNVRQSERRMIEQALTSAAGLEEGKDRGSSFVDRGSLVPRTTIPDSRITVYSAAGLEESEDEGEGGERPSLAPSLTDVTALLTGSHEDFTTLLRQAPGFSEPAVWILRTRFGAPPFSHYVEPEEIQMRILQLLGQVRAVAQDEIGQFLNDVIENRGSVYPESVVAAAKEIKAAREAPHAAEEELVKGNVAEVLGWVRTHHGRSQAEALQAAIEHFEGEERAHLEKNGLRISRGVDSLRRVRQITDEVVTLDDYVFTIPEQPTLELVLWRVLLPYELDRILINQQPNPGLKEMLLALRILARYRSMEPIQREGILRGVNQIERQVRDLTEGRAYRPLAKLLEEAGEQEIYVRLVWTSDYVKNPLLFPPQLSEALQGMDSADLIDRVKKMALQIGGILADMPEVQRINGLVESLMEAETIDSLEKVVDQLKVSIGGGAVLTRAERFPATLENWVLYLARHGAFFRLGRLSRRTREDLVSALGDTLPLAAAFMQSGELARQYDEVIHRIREMESQPDADRDELRRLEAQERTLRIIYQLSYETIPDRVLEAEAYLKKRGIEPMVASKQHLNGILREYVRELGEVQTDTEVADIFRQVLALASLGGAFDSVTFEAEEIDFPKSAKVWVMLLMMRGHLDIFLKNPDSVQRQLVRLHYVADPLAYAIMKSELFNALVARPDVPMEELDAFNVKISNVAQMPFQNRVPPLERLIDFMIVQLRDYLRSPDFLDPDGLANKALIVEVLDEMNRNRPDYLSVLGSGALRTELTNLLDHDFPLFKAAAGLEEITPRAEELGARIAQVQGAIPDRVAYDSRTGRLITVQRPLSIGEPKASGRAPYFYVPIGQSGSQPDPIVPQNKNEFSFPNFPAGMEVVGQHLVMSQPESRMLFILDLERGTALPHTPTLSIDEEKAFHPTLLTHAGDTLYLFDGSRIQAYGRGDLLLGEENLDWRDEVGKPHPPDFPATVDPKKLIDMKAASDKLFLLVLADQKRKGFTRIDAFDPKSGQRISDFHYRADFLDQLAVGSVAGKEWLFALEDGPAASRILAIDPAIDPDAQKQPRENNPAYILATDQPGVIHHIAFDPHRRAVLAVTKTSLNAPTDSYEIRSYPIRTDQRAVPGAGLEERIPELGPDWEPTGEKRTLPGGQEVEVLRPRDDSPLAGHIILERLPNGEVITVIPLTASDVPMALELWGKRLRLEGSLVTQKWLHIFAPENADLGVVVRGLILDPVVILAKDEEHANRLAEAGVPPEAVVRLDKVEGNLEAAYRLAKEKHPGFDPHLYPKEERSQLTLWIVNLLRDYKIQRVTAEQFRRMVDALSVLLSA